MTERGAPLPRRSLEEKERNFKQLEADLNSGTLTVARVRESRNKIGEADYHHLFERLAEQLEMVATIDPLTEANNRRLFNIEIDRLLRTLDQNMDDGRKESFESLMVIFCDIKEFKKLNDTKGHAEGDEALRRLALALENSARSSGDRVFRVGGDEFIVLLTLPVSNPQTHAAIFSRIQKEVHLGLPFEISMGCVIRNKGENLSAAEILDMADKKMYEDKKLQYSKSEEQLSLNFK